jgi:hypothetical protein
MKRGHSTWATLTNQLTSFCRGTPLWSNMSVGWLLSIFSLIFAITAHRPLCTSPILPRNNITRSCVPSNERIVKSVSPQTRIHSLFVATHFQLTMCCSFHLSQRVSLFANYRTGNCVRHHNAYGHFLWYWSYKYLRVYLNILVSDTYHPPDQRQR